MIKAIIFDCFGVIKADAFEDSYRSFGGDPDKDRDFIKSTLDAANGGMIPSSMPLVAERLGIGAGAWKEAIESASTIDFEILDYVLELRKTYKVAMLSNISKGGFERHFDPGFLEKYFEVAVGSGDIGFAKPEARAYETVADLLGVRLDESVFVDDRQDYVDGAIAVGMRAILYQNLGQLKQELGKILA